MAESIGMAMMAARRIFPTIDWMLYPIRLRPAAIQASDREMTDQNE
jgi:hypothetical protein